MKKFLSVLYDFGYGEYFEPGVAQSPTFELQKRAVDLFLQKVNGIKVAELITSKDHCLINKDFETGVREIRSAVLFSVKSLQNSEGQINLKLLSTMHKKFSEIYFLVESIFIFSRQDFESVAKKFICINFCNFRDISEEWKEIIKKLKIQ